MRDVGCQVALDSNLDSLEGQLGTLEPENINKRVFDRSPN